MVITVCNVGQWQSGQSVTTSLSPDQLVSGAKRDQMAET